MKKKKKKKMNKNKKKKTRAENINSVKSFESLVIVFLFFVLSCSHP